MEAKEKKAQIVAELKDKFENSSSAVLIDYRGITVAEATAMREECRKAGVVYKIYKNTLTERAVKELGYDDLVPYLKGPTAIAFGAEDPVAPAKLLSDTIKKLKKMEFKVGLVEGKVIDVAGVNALASLPSREELLAKMLGSMNAPITGLAMVLSGTIRSLLYALKAVEEKKSA